MKNTKKNQPVIPAFYAKIVGDLLIVETNERTLPLFGTETVTLPKELKFAFCKKSEACAELKSKFSYVYLSTIKKSLRGKAISSLFCATILLEIRDYNLSEGPHYLCNL